MPATAASAHGPEGAQIQRVKSRSPARALARRSIAGTSSRSRTLDADVGVPPTPGEVGRSAGRGEGALRIDAADVHSAGESDAPVDDQNLAVIAVVELPDPRMLEGIQRTEGVQLDSRGAKTVEIGSSCGRPPSSRATTGFAPGSTCGVRSTGETQAERQSQASASASRLAMGPRARLIARAPCAP